VLLPFVLLLQQQQHSLIAILALVSIYFALSVMDGTGDSKRTWPKVGPSIAHSAGF